MKTFVLIFLLAACLQALLEEQKPLDTTQESQKSDIIIPSVNGKPIKVSVDKNVNALQVDGHRINYSNRKAAMIPRTRFRRRHLQEGEEISQEEVAEEAELEGTPLTAEEVAEEKEEIAEEGELEVPVEESTAEPHVYTIEELTDVIENLEEMADGAVDDQVCFSVAEVETLLAALKAFRRRKKEAAMAAEDQMPAEGEVGEDLVPEDIHEGELEAEEALDSGEGEHHAAEGPAEAEQEAMRRDLKILKAAKNRIRRRHMKMQAIRMRRRHRHNRLVRRGRFLRDSKVLLP